MFWKENRKTFFLLWLACVIGNIMQVFFSLKIGNFHLGKDILLQDLVLDQCINIIFYGILIFIGLWFATKVKFKILPRIRDFNCLVFKPAFIFGALCAVILFPSVIFIFNTIERSVCLGPTYMGTALDAFFISITAGILEETMFRLFLMSLLVWLQIKCFSLVRDDRFAVWVGIIVSGILFGLFHVPAAKILGIPLTTAFIIKEIGLGLACGGVFGYVYWRYSLVTAILTHTIFDIVFYVILRSLYLWIL